MTEQVQDTVAQADDNIETVTDSANPVDVTTESKSEQQAPTVEFRDGKYYMDGQRIYTRDDTNRIAANAKKDVESRILQELNVDSFDSVKSVVQTLQETTPEAQGLNVESLRDAVKKREQTVEELQSQVNQLKTSLLLKDHMSQLQSAMPGNWNTDQKQAVVDLMQARNMLAVEGDTFAIRNGDSFLTTDGETPDYAGAVEVVGKSLGLPFGKQGVNLQYGETNSDTSVNKTKPLDESRLLTDSAYRSAYTKLRQYNPSVKRSTITDAMVKKQMDKARG